MQPNSDARNEAFAEIRQRGEMLTRITEDANRFNEILDAVEAWDIERFGGRIPELPPGLNCEEFRLTKCDIVETIKCERQCGQYIALDKAQTRSFAQTVAHIWSNQDVLVELEAALDESNDTARTRLLDIGSIYISDRPIPEWLLDILCPVVCQTVKEWHCREITILYGCH